MKIALKLSPHQSARPGGVRPRLVVLHADASGSAEASINWMLNPDSKVSYHYIISRDGGITQLVLDERKAWHAGTSSFAGSTNCNDFAIGVCFSNKNDGLEKYDARAIQMGVELVAGLLRRWAFGLDGITTHEAVARPMGRKSDPGIAFPLSEFVTAVRRRLARP